MRFLPIRTGRKARYGQGGLDRRDFLRNAGVSLLGVALTRCGFQSIDPLVAGIEVPFLTPIEDHYVKHGAEGSLAGWRLPNIAADAWRLTIDGLVQQPLTITLADFVAEPQIEVIKTMQCVVDASTALGLVGTALWGGVPLRTFIERAGLDPSVKRLRMYGADGFTGNVPVDRITPQPGAVEPLLVTHMNGVPLPRQNGAPVRLIVPDGFGYASVKWLERIEATADDSVFGTYQDAGFTDEARSPVFSKITSPTDNLRVAAGPVTFFGFAVSGQAAVTGVEVRVNDGPWLPARMASAAEVTATAPSVANAVQLRDPATYGFPAIGVWALWSASFDLPPGRHTIRARASDASGARQPDRDLEISDGVNAVAAIRVEVG